MPSVAVVDRVSGSSSVLFLKERPREAILRLDTGQRERAREDVGAHESHDFGLFCGGVPWVFKLQSVKDGHSR